MCTFKQDLIQITCKAMNKGRIGKLIHTLKHKSNVSVNKIADLASGSGGFNNSTHNMRQRKKVKVYGAIQTILVEGKGSCLQKLRAMMKVNCPLLAASAMSTRLQLAADPLNYLFVPVCN